MKELHYLSAFPTTATTCLGLRNVWYSYQNNYGNKYLPVCSSQNNDRALVFEFFKQLKLFIMVTFSGRIECPRFTKFLSPTQGLAYGSNFPVDPISYMGRPVARRLRATTQPTMMVPEYTIHRFLKSLSHSFTHIHSPVLLLLASGSPPCLFHTLLLCNSKM